MVLSALEARQAPVDKRHLAKSLGLRGDARRALTFVLRDLTRDGRIASVSGNRVVLVRAPATRDGLIPIEIVGTDVEDGTLLVKALEWTGPSPLARLTVAAGHPSPPVGARGLGRFEFADGEWRATLARLVEPEPERLVGRLMRAGSGWRLEPTDRRIRTEFVVEDDRLQPSDNGLLVLAEVLVRRRLGLPRVRIVEKIGHFGDPKSASLIAIHAQGIPTEFPPDAVALAARAHPAGTDQREDLRTLPICTIDGADARDFDDAVFAEPDDDPENPGGWRLIVAIADVSWYVRSGDALDICARQRGNSCYFPDRVVPMLPERLSNDLCSLRPDEDRPVLAAHIVVDRDGRKRRHRFTRATIRSAKRFTYEEFQAIADGKRHAPEMLVSRVVQPLFGAYRALAAARTARGALDIDVEERKVELDSHAKVASIRPRVRLDSHRLIEEMMILANVCAAETLERRKLPCVYRVHEPPAADRVEALRETLDGLGLKLSGGTASRPQDFVRILDWAKGQPWHAMVNQLVLRCQSLAVYSTANQGHFGLALPRYAHFTSPIRRYADLLVHRALVTGERLGAGGLPDGDNAADFADAADHISATERRAVAAERDAMARYVAAYLEDHKGSTFPGRVTGVQNFGLFVTLDEIGADGLVPIRTLPHDFYRFDERRHRLVGERNGRIYVLGAAVEVRLNEVDGLTGSLTFDLLDKDGGKPPARGSFRRTGHRKPRRH